MSIQPAVKAGSVVLLIAPCGMNCGTCLAYLRIKNHCKGCRILDDSKAKSCANCIIKNCSLLVRTKSNFCYDCEKYPCKRLKDLDKRYRTKYNTSFLANLESIKSLGLDEHVKREHEKWKCANCGGTICIHRGFCLQCNTKAIPVG
jgi:hypothetical protein